MPKKSLKIGLTTKRHLDDPEGVVKGVARYLRRRGHQVFVCSKGCNLIPGEKPTLSFKRKYDLLMTFGGDGSILRTVQYMENFNSLVLPINMGTLGFLMEFRPERLKEALKKFFEKDYKIEERILLRATVVRNGEKVFTKRALNDTVMARDALARMVKLKTTVDDRKFTTYVADGLIVATPTGSTAYSLSAGGPIVHPDFSAMVLTPISPHSFTQKPIIIPAEKKIKIHIGSKGERIYLTIDGQMGFQLQDGDIVKIKKSSKILKFVRFSESTYFKTLRKKLNWGETK